MDNNKNCWSAQAWRSVEEIYARTVAHPFVKELAAGTLDEACFRRYLQQDALYLREYSRVLAHVATRLADTSQAAAFVAFAADGVAVEQALHESFLHGCHAGEMSPACTLYTSVLKSCAYEPVEVEAAAVLPCFWVYQRVGKHILSLQSDAAANPYRRWIETYADPAFAASTRRAIGICDELAAASTESMRERMTAVFKQCARLEWMFWDSAYTMEQWKI